MFVVQMYLVQLQRHYIFCCKLEDRMSLYIRKPLLDNRGTAKQIDFKAHILKILNFIADYNFEYTGTVTGSSL